MKKFRKLLSVVLAVSFISLICAGCSHPRYNRSVVRTYGPDGKLVGTVVTENVDQLDPNGKPLLDVLENQTFTK